MKYYIFIYAITAISQIYLCDAVFERTLRAEQSVTADGALKPLRLSRLSPSNSDRKRAGLTNPKESSSHILKGIVSDRLVQPQTNVQQYQLHQQRQRQQQQQQQQQQPQQPQTLQTIIGNNNTQMPRCDQQIIKAEQQLRHQHKPNHQLSGQNNNGHFENHRNYEEHGRRNPDVNGRHFQIESVHNYDIIYKVSKENSSIRHVANNSGGDDISLPRDNPVPAIIDAKKLTTFTKETATTTPANIAMKLVALSDSRQSAIQITPTLVSQLANPSTLSPFSASFHHLPALQKTRLRDDSSEVDANHVTPIAFSKTFRNRRNIPENPFLHNYMAQNHLNGQKTSAHTNTYAQNPSPHFPSHVQNSTEKTHFKQNPFLQNYTMRNPSHQTQSLPNGGTTRNPWLHGATPKPSSADSSMQKPYSQQPLSVKPLLDLTQDVKSQNNKYISSTTSTTTSSTTQRTLMPETTLIAPTLPLGLRQLVKNGAIIFPDSLYLTPTPTPSRLQQTIGIRRR